MAVTYAAVSRLILGVSQGQQLFKPRMPFVRTQDFIHAHSVLHGLQVRCAFLREFPERMDGADHRTMRGLLAFHFVGVWVARQKFGRFAGVMF